MHYTSLVFNDHLLSLSTYRNTSLPLKHHSKNICRKVLVFQKYCGMASKNQSAPKQVTEHMEGTTASWTMGFTTIRAGNIKGG